MRSAFCGGRSRAAGTDIGALAHLTGGGWEGNLPRTLPDGLGVEVETGSWPVPAIFSLIQQRGDIADDEMVRTFNLGIGMTAVVPVAAVEAALAALPEACRIGRGRRGSRGRGARPVRMRLGVLVSGRGTNLEAILDAGLSVALVVSNRPGVRALEVAAAHGVPSAVLRRSEYADASARDAAIGAALAEAGVELAVLAGWDQLLRPSTSPRSRDARSTSIRACCPRTVGRG